MKVRVLLLILLFMPAGTILSQATRSKKAIDAYNRALQNYSLNDYTKAEELLQEAIRADETFLDAYLLLAEVFIDDRKPLNAIDIYIKAMPMDEKHYPYGYVKLASLEVSEGKYPDALIHYRKFLELKTGTPEQQKKAEDGVKRCTFAVEAMKHPVEFKPVNLGASVNTPSDEYWPCLSADEHTLVITRLDKSYEFMKKVQEDFYISQWESTSWGVMKNAGSPLNTADNEGAQTVSGDGRFMIFTACNRSDGAGRCDLYWSRKQGDRWSIPKNIGKPVNSAYRETQPSITPDGRTLYFSSDRPGGKGGHDIWMSRLDSADRWTQPENLGEMINTAGIEMSPFIHPDNRSLYLSSDGLTGMGGYDLFVVRRDDSGRWTAPVNLGYPINTNRDEIGLIVNARGDKAYYASDVDQTMGKDIYIFDMPLADRPTMVTYMKGKVFDADTKRPLRANFELIDLETGKLFYKSGSDSITGEFLVSIPVDHNFMLNVSKRGYLFHSENFSLKGTFRADKPFLKDVPLEPVQIGKRIVLNNVFYETDAFDLKKESRLELNKVVQFLRTNPGVRIEVSGHTDNTGNADYNQVLSENRARTVADYLISASLNPDRIVYKGYGMTVPVTSNDTEEGKAMNRRTEIKIIQ
jgi:flagellar motor protein MotB